MFGKQERIAVLIMTVVLIICGVATVTLESIGKEPFAQNYTAQSPEGSLVILQGVVQEVTPLSSGTFNLLTINGIPVFLTQKAAKIQVTQGSLVSLCGIVQTYKGKKEVVVSDPEDIRIIAESQEKNLRF